MALAPLFCAPDEHAPPPLLPCPCRPSGSLGLDTNWPEPLQVWVHADAAGDAILARVNGSDSQPITHFSKPGNGTSCAVAARGMSILIMLYS